VFFFFLFVRLRCIRVLFSGEVVWWQLQWNKIFLGWEALVGKELRVAIDKEWGICHQQSYLGCSKDGKGANSLVYGTS